MKMNYWSMITGAFLLASCGKSPEPAPAADGAGAPAPADVGADAAKANLIKPGKYRVCQDADESGHGSVVGPHIVVGQTVEIKAFGDKRAKVCLGNDCPSAGSRPPESEVKVMWLAGDENKLAGESTFEHQQENGQTVRLPHFVEIFSDPDDRGDAGLCEKPNVLTINFCTEDEMTGELNCVGGRGPHLGHVHVEN